MALPAELVPSFFQVAKEVGGKEVPGTLKDNIFGFDIQKKKKVLNQYIIFTRIIDFQSFS